jgi:7-cyano-7-deazaguanine reductase
MEFSASQPSIEIADTRGKIDPEAKYSLLQCFPLANQHPQLIHIRTTEFSAVCPGTGLPDIGTMDIEYLPATLCLELKSLKYYLVAYRPEGIFQEPVTDLIFGHLLRALVPQFLRIQLTYNTRGGFDTTTVCEHGSRAGLQLMQYNRL